MNILTCTLLFLFDDDEIYYLDCIPIVPFVWNQCNGYELNNKELMISIQQIIAFG